MFRFFFIYFISLCIIEAIVKCECHGVCWQMSRSTQCEILSIAEYDVCKFTLRQEERGMGGGVVRGWAGGPWLLFGSIDFVTGCVAICTNLIYTLYSLK